MFGSDGMRIPVGASDDPAAAAERLQFTAAEGPCLDAQALARSVLATETLIEQRWPDFYSGLVTRTPFRAGDRSCSIKLRRMNCTTSP